MSLRFICRLFVVCCLFFVVVVLALFFNSSLFGLLVVACSLLLWIRVGCILLRVVSSCLLSVCRYCVVWGDVCRLLLSLSVAVSECRCFFIKKMLLVAVGRCLLVVVRWYIGLMMLTFMMFRRCCLCSWSFVAVVLC